MDLRELLLALKDVILRAELTGRHAISARPCRAQPQSDVLKRSATASSIVRTPVQRRGRPPGIVVTFLAILELAKEHLIEIMQNEPLTPIYLKSLATAA